MKHIFISITILLVATQISFSQAKKSKNEKKSAKVTFIELGSVRCIPCQKMEAVLDSIRKKYPKDVEVIFYDVWTEKGKPFAKQYGVKTIPTQVFLDKNGKEYYRHIGFFKESELVKILKLKGAEK